MIIKDHIDDELQSLIHSLKDRLKANKSMVNNKLNGKLYIDLNYANMEVLYPKWFNECLQDSNLGKCFKNAYAKLDDSDLESVAVTKDEKVSPN